MTCCTLGSIGICGFGMIQATECYHGCVTSSTVRSANSVVGTLKAMFSKTLFGTLWFNYILEITLMYRTNRVIPELKTLEVHVQWEFQDPKMEVLLPYIRPIWYSTAILGSWNSH